MEQTEVKLIGYTFWRSETYRLLKQYNAVSELVEDTNTSFIQVKFDINRLPEFERQKIKGYIDDGFIGASLVFNPSSS